MQKWQIELNASPMWLLQSLIGVIAALAVVVLLVSRTRFGREFWQITRPCLSRSGSLKIVLLMLFILVLLLTEIRLNVLNTFFYNGLYSALQDAKAQAFWFFALINAAVVTLRTLNGIINDFLDQALAIKWSQRLNQVLVSRWMADKNYYRLHMRRAAPDNIDQRIQQDAQDFIASSIEFVRGMIESVVTAIEFTIVLWGLSGILSILGYEIPRGIVFFVFIFALLSTVGAMWVGRPLIRHNFENEKLNGDYRYALIRVRDHAESIAFYHGEAGEEAKLSDSFRAVIRNRWRIARQSVALGGYNTMLTQGVQLLPLMLQAPRFFAGQIKIGDMHQTVQAFTRLQRSLSFFRNFYGKFTAYRARLERLSGFFDSMQPESSPAEVRRQVSEGSLKVDKLSLYRSNGDALIENINLQAAPGDSLLIQGASGCGKTSLLRALAGLWPFGVSGEISAPPQEDIMFVPQRSYVPQGSLREAVCYPDIDPQHPDLENAMRDCCMEKWLPYLDITDDWQHRLSPGELQRIAFIRILLARPRLVLLDESTAALDEPTEETLYQLLLKRLPDSTLVSIGHRCTLAAYHKRSILIA
ncbi:ABC transporter ATP-binding protein/permease [Kingella sp. SNUBH-2017]|uniref:ABC transporter ATP-binding protein/permease n=1 Tax=Kingella sp. SNUBH-2017 TaxID=2994077 RepID=UPI00236495AF|nr:ABC transporter ATP-binding protein/permease [Kingella sp. SNUBH-2017]MDD2183212.1 ABC transporter ATP-binding protein/permease [Kingella sp. SNUBH-2017]